MLALKLPARNLTGVAEAEREISRETLIDFAEASSGEKILKRVSGVPSKDSAPPLDERGEVWWNESSRACSMASDEQETILIEDSR